MPLPAAGYTLQSMRKHCTKAREGPSGLVLGMYHHLEKLTCQMSTNET